ncbi:unnamed protein product [Symbiodinium natans]|uniref:Uncharacterized protein n=1 Tax=Symbiodinium natans TaxID=878477 RepID=A0A812T101_9DINO|nr:unnamed protein product [Symbiodinium natans]
MPEDEAQAVHEATLDETSEEVIPEVKTKTKKKGPEGGKDSFSLARNTSKTAIGKRYFATSLGKKGLVHSRSLRMQDGDAPVQPRDERESAEAPANLQATAEAEEEEADASKEMTARQRWKLGALAVQAVVRLRAELVASPAPRRDSETQKRPPAKIEIVRELTEPEPPPPESIAAPALPKRRPRAAKADHEAARKTVEESPVVQTLHEAPAVPVEDGDVKAPLEAPKHDSVLLLRPDFAALDNGASLPLTAAAIQAVRSLDEPDLSHFRKSEARLLSAKTQTTAWLSHDSSRITFFSAKSDSVNSTVGFSPYASQTDLLKNASGTTLSYQSSAAKLSIASIEEEAVQTASGAKPAASKAKPTASEAARLLPSVGALEEELIGDILASPSPEPDEDLEEMTRYGPVLEMRKPPPISTSRRGSIIKVPSKPGPAGPGLVLSHLAKPSPRQPASARGAREPPGAMRRRPVYS